MKNKKSYKRELLPRITIELDSKDYRKKFVDKVHASGMTMRGLLTLWIKEYMQDSPVSNNSD